MICSVLCVDSCSFFNQKDCESGPCVWNGDSCEFDKCLNSSERNCPKGCEPFFAHQDELPYTQCRTEGAYIDYCWIGYGDDLENGVERCKQNSSCEIIKSEQGFKDYFKEKMPFNVDELCVTKNRSSGSHKKGTYNYDILCGFFPKKYCNGGPCIWTDGKCLTDQCTFKDAEKGCPDGCSLFSISNFKVCTKPGKSFDSCTIQYYDMEKETVNIDGCKGNSTCELIDFPSYLNFVQNHAPNQICALKNGTPVPDDDDGASIINRKLGLAFILLFGLFIFI
jgi:hypothetical protein